MCKWERACSFDYLVNAQVRFCCRQFITDNGRPPSLALNPTFCLCIHPHWSVTGCQSQSPLRPCPHDTFPNWARSIAPSSRPVARVHTGATGTLVPDPRDHLSTWNEWARSIAIGCALSNLSCGRSSGRYRPVSKSAAVGTRLIRHTPSWSTSSPFRHTFAVTCLQ